MTLEISDNLLKHIGLTPEELRLNFAIYLFSAEKITIGQASRIAGIHQMEFQKELAKRKIAIHYDETDLERDLKTIENFD